MKPALVIIDMVDDFVFGKFGSQGTESIITIIKDLIATAKTNHVPVIYLQDHHKDGDPELLIWGEHAMEGTKGSEIVSELKPDQDDVVIKKHVYSGFFKTELQEIIEKRNLDTLFFTGVSTDICVRHNVAEAFFRGLKSFVIIDGTAAIDNNVHDSALTYMEKTYGAELIESSSVKELFETQG